MKLYRNIVILAFMIIALVLVWGSTGKRTKVEMKPENVDNTIAIFDFDADSITHITIVNSDSRFELERKEGKWTSIFPEGMRVNDYTIDMIAEYFSNLTALKIVKDNEENVKLYGLDDPSTITVRLDDGTEKTLEIGDLTPTNDNYYAKVKGDSRIFTIGGYIGDQFKSKKENIRQRILFDVLPEEIHGFSLERGGKTVFVAKRTENGNWEIIRPVHQAVADSSEIESMVFFVSNLAVFNFIEEMPSDIGKYGLEDPAYAIEFETEQSIQRLLLGSEKVKGYEIYAKLADNNETFTLSMELLYFLDVPLDDLIKSG